ncbi:2-C-methyl-D-erythritol 4-phosphate cytidylyltransferase [Blastopirellula sp. JC732]|uniref:2-C-methyl-D-erythritol 4-phosphate cytidylyltransferase n=1 Tax=Blastopirellula sediminis TaxID=2894196 RepID=A0A9X1MHZ8_9BACT|nr:2-C-methyl-D-erythritol 4-phosphate cytidylyltransferase [Blastopirellula sediminis]MCC9609691.1 2-C-methyl-D-erythritol 4-phosphate cytidylyltransferase [Blastopirellula sediminis]MCC9627533.1 2-C-methyl-D-erythritol 4-phosphate cytidylyltransferase [Blastopirellula sediminis]
MRNFGVILPAAGRSTRFGDPRQKKVYAPLAGKAVWLHSAERFAARDDVDQVIVVISPEDEESFRADYAAEIDRLHLSIALGGAERSDSISNAIALLDEDIEMVAVHDAARPCISDKLIDDVFAAAIEHGAAMLATPVAGTLKRVFDDRTIQETVSRTGIWEAQTPQVFRRDWFAEAYETRTADAVTDDAQLLERMGRSVLVVPGSQLNRKITTQEDLLIAAATLAMI